MNDMSTPRTQAFARLPGRAEIEQALTLVHQYVPATPQRHWPLLSERCGCTVYVKHENHAPTGAFKVRGGLTYLHKLRASDPDVAGVVAATRGNHGQSIAMASRSLGLRCVIVVPEGNCSGKNDAMRALGAELVVHGHDFQAAADYAKTLAQTERLHFVPSFHSSLLEGVATYGWELFGALPDLDAVFVPIGMGSGIAGLIAAKQALGVSTAIIGVVAEGAPAYALSYKAGKPVPTNRAETIADGLACRSPDAMATEVVVAGATDVVQVSEQGIREAMRTYFTDTHNIAEGAGAAPLAALLARKEEWRGRKVALILSGGNVDSVLYRSILE
jgi:threonine dehydratase